MNSEVLILTADLLKWLEVKEREALVGTIEFGRVSKKKDKEKEEKGSRFQLAPNFGFPAACDERPVSADGRITIHFKQSLVVKKAKYKGEKRGKASDLVIKGDKDAAEVISSSPSAASDQDSYISREGAVMTITAALFEGYIAGGNLEQGQKAIISNISNDPKERKVFWDAVVRRERTPSPDVITLYPERLTLQEWSKVAVGLERGHTLKRIITEAVKSRLLMDTGAVVQPDPVSLEIDGRHFPELCARLKKVTDLDRSKLPASIWRGRGGRVQRRFVGELPAGISEEARLKIALAFAEYLRGLGMMYTVVIHAPDHHNHKKNFHLHAVAYDRPCRFLVDKGCWDFDYAEPVPGQYKRFRFPKRQDKPAKLTRSTDGRGNFRFYGAALIEEFRRVFTALCNEQLRLTGLNCLYDHRSYKVLRIYQKPQKHLGTKAASLGAVGVPVNSVIENAELSWQAAFNNARAAHRLRLQVRSDCRTEASMMLARFRELDGEPELAGRLAREIGQLDAITKELGDQELHIENLRLTLKMVMSSADKTEESCMRLLDAIQAGSATPSEYAMEAEIRKRLAEAQAFQDRVYGAEQERIQKAVELAQVLMGKTKAVEQTMERIRECIDAMEAQITRVPTARSEDAPSEKTGAAQKKVDARSRRIQAYYDAPLDYEESWDRVFSRIQYEELEIKPPSSETPVFHVPGISREELNLLLNPFFEKRSQARLQQLHKYQEMNRRRNEKRQAAEASLNGDALETANAEAQASKSMDPVAEKHQAEVVHEPSPAAGEDALEHREPAASADSVIESSKSAEVDATAPKLPATKANPEQISETQKVDSGRSRFGDAFEEKRLRGPKQRPDNPLRKVAKEIAEGMTPEDAEDAVNGVVKTKPEVREVGPSGTSIEPTSKHPQSAVEPQHSTNREAEENQRDHDQTQSKIEDEGVCDEVWKAFKNAGRGR